MTAQVGAHVGHEHQGVAALAEPGERLVEDAAPVRREPPEPVDVDPPAVEAEELAVEERRPLVLALVPPDEHQAHRCRVGGQGGVGLLSDEEQPAEALELVTGGVEVGDEVEEVGGVVAGELAGAGPVEQARGDVAGRAVLPEALEDVDPAQVGVDPAERLGQVVVARQELLPGPVEVGVAGPHDQLVHGVGQLLEPLALSEQAGTGEGGGQCREPLAGQQPAVVASTCAAVTARASGRTACSQVTGNSTTGSSAWVTAISSRFPTRGDPRAMRASAALRSSATVGRNPLSQAPTMAP